MSKAVDRRAAAILSRLPAGPATGAEVGVFRGRLARRLLWGKQDLTLHLVDSWLAGEKQTQTYRASGDAVTTLSRHEMADAKKEALVSTEFAANRRLVYCMDSVKAAKVIPDDSLGFVFIDAEHTYEGCSRDIAAWRSKVKAGGLLCGHDYGNANFPGVMRAVDEHVGAVERGDDNTWFYRV